MTAGTMNHAGEPRRRGLALTIVGAVLMFVVAPGSFITGTVLGVKDAVHIVSGAPLIQPGGTITLQQGERLRLYAYAGASSASDGVSTSMSDTSSQTTEPTTCDVAGPGGGQVTVTPSTSNTTWTRSGSRYTEAASFTADQAGAYTVRCGDHPALAPSADDASKAGHKALTYIGIALAIAAVLGILGLILLIVGIVKLVNSGKERSQYRLAMQNQAWQRGYGPPYRG